MPCLCDYPEPTEREIEESLVDEHLDYLGLWKDSRQMDLDKKTELLCFTIRGLSAAELNFIVYNGRNADARKLADWWDKHQEEDKERAAAEAKKKLAAETAERALYQGLHKKYGNKY